jgi:hypothetical protein
VQSQFFIAAAPSPALNAVHQGRTYYFNWMREAFPMNQHRFSRRYFLYGSLLAGAVPMRGFGSTPSLKALGYKSPNGKLNVAAVGMGTRGPQIRLVEVHSPAALELHGRGPEEGHCRAVQEGGAKARIEVRRERAPGAKLSLVLHFAHE